MKHLKSHLILESSNQLTKEYLDKVFSQLGVKFQFIPGRKGYQLPKFKVTIEEPKIFGRTYGYDNYLEYLDRVKDLYEFHETLSNCIQFITDEFDNEFEIDIIESSIKKEVIITFYA